MAWTKRDLITSAFEEIGLAAFVFDLTAEQWQAAAKRLDAMMASLNQRGLQIGYNMASTPGAADVDALAGIPDGAYELVICGLAIRLAPQYGKAVPIETKAAYSAAYDSLMRAAAQPQNIAIPRGYPVGAGYKSIPGHYAEFAPGASETLSAGDQPLEFD